MERLLNYSGKVLCITLLISIISLAFVSESYCDPKKGNGASWHKPPNHHFANGMIDKIRDALCSNEISVPEDYETIQEAIDAACLGNTIINVSGGPYVEAVEIIGKRNIVLQGEGDTEIIGMSTETDVIFILHSIVAVSGFNISGGMNGIHSGASSVNCGNNIIENNNANGVLAVAGSDFHFYGDIMIAGNAEAGFWLGHRSSSDNSVCESFEISGNGGQGIQVGGLSRLRLGNSIISDNGSHGITLGGSSGILSLGGNLISGNLGDGIRMNTNANLSIGTRSLGDEISDNNGDGISARGGSISFGECTIDNNTGNGISISAYASLFINGPCSNPYVSISSNGGYGLFCTSKSAFNGLCKIDFTDNTSGEYCPDCTEGL